MPEGKDESRRRVSACASCAREDRGSYVQFAKLAHAERVNDWRAGRVQPRPVSRRAITVSPSRSFAPAPAPRTPLPPVTYENTLAAMSSARTPSPLKRTALPLIQNVCILAARSGPPAQTLLSMLLLRLSRPRSLRLSLLLLLRLLAACLLRVLRVLLRLEPRRPERVRSALLCAARRPLWHRDSRVPEQVAHGTPAALCARSTAPRAGPLPAGRRPAARAVLAVLPRGWWPPPHRLAAGNAGCAAARGCCCCCCAAAVAAALLRRLSRL